MKNSFVKLSFPLLVMCSSFMFACKKESEAKEGKANITLTYGGQQLNIEGSCGWATAMGVKYIGANHSSSSIRSFMASFNMDNPPSSTTTYTLVDDQLDENPSHVWMSITDMVNSSFVEWTSFDGSGNLTLTVSGKKVTVNLGGITLEPGSINAAPYNQSGTLSGTLEFYRD